MQFEIVIRVHENDPLAEREGSRFVLMAQTRDPFVANTIRDHYLPLGWVKGVTILDTDANVFVADAVAHKLGVSESIDCACGAGCIDQACTIQEIGV